MKILFLHGWHSIPGGVKPTYLKKHGHQVVNQALADPESLAKMLEACERMAGGSAAIASFD